MFHMVLNKPLMNTAETLSKKRFQALKNLQNIPIKVISLAEK